MKVVLPVTCLQQRQAPCLSTDNHAGQCARPHERHCPAGGAGRTRRRHRNYLETSLALAASVAAELTNSCPTVGGGLA